MFKVKMKNILEKKHKNVWMICANDIPLHPLSKRKAFKE